MRYRPLDIRNLFGCVEAVFVIQRQDRKQYSFRKSFRRTDLYFPLHPASAESVPEVQVTILLCLRTKSLLSNVFCVMGCVLADQTITCCCADIMISIHDIVLRLPKQWSYGMVD